METWLVRFQREANTLPCPLYEKSVMSGQLELKIWLGLTRDQNLQGGFALLRQWMLVSWSWRINLIKKRKSSEKCFLKTSTHNLYYRVSIKWWKERMWDFQFLSKFSMYFLTQSNSLKVNLPWYISLGIFWQSFEFLDSYLPWINGLN